MRARIGCERASERLVCERVVLGAEKGTSASPWLLAKGLRPCLEQVKQQAHRLARLVARVSALPAARGRRHGTVKDVRWHGESLPDSRGGRLRCTASQRQSRGAGQRVVALCPTFFKTSNVEKMSQLDSGHPDMLNPWFQILNL